MIMKPFLAVSGAAFALIVVPLAYRHYQEGAPYRQFVMNVPLN
jgi:hypothetical protein